jgi:hypothetical protein
MSPFPVWLLVATLALTLLSAPQRVPAGGGAPNAETQDADQYWCPMHPHIRGAKGDRCRICGMALVPAPLPGYAPYHLDVDTRPQAPIAGRPTDIRLSVRDPRTGKPVKDFERVHERIFHLFILSQDLEYFVHVHPTRQRDGSFVQTAVLPRPGVYRLLADFLPVGGAPQLVQQSVVTAGYAGSLMPGAALQPDVADKIVEGVRVKLSMPAAIAGREQLLTFEFWNAATGAPVADLEPYLGAVGHLLLVSADLQAAAHSHPVADMSGAVGPTVVFQAMFPRPGAYRFWVQFQRQGRILVAPFTVVARPANQVLAR